MMEKIRVKEVVVVEGRYDAVAVAGVVDGLILATDGFSIFSNTEQKELLRKLGRQRGLLILTDSDAAGFRIRNYVQKIAAGCDVKHAYIPAVKGKESRKAAPSAEGTLGVEGLSPEVLRRAVEQAGATPCAPRAGRPVSYTDLYEAGLSGGKGSAQVRRRLLQRLGLPPRLSKKALCQVLNSLFTYEEFMNIVMQKPVLFWDFHGTLTLPDVVWFDAAMEAAAELAPEHTLDRDTLVKYFHGTCLPWFSIPQRDTRHVAGSGPWWAHCTQNFAQMFVQCGFTDAQAARIAPALRARVLQPQRYQLYDDALPTLRLLQQQGYESHILSNNYPELEDIVTALGLRPYFGRVLVSGCIGYEKPRAEIFAAALEATGAPSWPWMIGDNPIDDIEGAAAAGFTTVAVHGRPAPAATHQVGSLAEIPSLLEADMAQKSEHDLQ